jgi:hypothetical protein
MFIKLKDLTDFKWDRVYIFTPYTRHEKIDEALGFVWQPASTTVLRNLRDLGRFEGHANQAASSGS